MTQIVLGSNDPAPQGKFKLIFWSIGFLCLIGAGIAVYFLVFKKPQPPPSPTDSQGSFGDWKSRDGYVGSVEPVDCSKDTVGQICSTKGEGTGICQTLKSAGASVGADSYSCLPITPGQPGYAETGKDCAATCYKNGENYWALFNSSTKACICRSKKSDDFWDKCVIKDVDAKRWEVWSTAEHQQDCDISKIHTYSNIWKGVTEDGDVASVNTKTLEGCRAEIKGQLARDPKSYGVFTDGVCNVKTDDPTKNPFWECKWQDPSLSTKYTLVTDVDKSDKVMQLPDCIPIKSVPVTGTLPVRYLRGRQVVVPPTINQKDSDVGAWSCLNHCGQLNASENVPETGAKPAVTWDNNTNICTCYDFPKSDSVWKCQYSDNESFEIIQTLYVRNGADDPLALHIDTEIPSSLPECPHDPEGAPDPHDPGGVACPTGTVDECTTWRYDNPGTHQCRWNNLSFVPIWGNANNCGGQGSPIDQDLCVKGTTVKCSSKDTHYGYRCGSSEPIFGGPCQLGTGSRDCPGMVCYAINGHMSDDDDECGACQFKNDDNGRRGKPNTTCTYQDQCISGVCLAGDDPNVKTCT